MIKVTVRGGKEAAAKFRALRSQTPAMLDLAVQAGALIVENAAKEKAPVKSGNLRRSITSKKA